MWEQLAIVCVSVILTSAGNYLLFGMSKVSKKELEQSEKRTKELINLQVAVLSNPSITAIETIKTRLDSILDSLREVKESQADISRRLSEVEKHHV